MSVKENKYLQRSSSLKYNFSLISYVKKDTPKNWSCFGKLSNRTGNKKNLSEESWEHSRCQRPKRVKEQRVRENWSVNREFHLETKQDSLINYFLHQKVIIKDYDSFNHKYNKHLRQIRISCFDYDIGMHVLEHHMTQHWIYLSVEETDLILE